MHGPLRTHSDHGGDQPQVPAGDDWEAHWDSFGDSAAANPAQTCSRRLLVSWLNLRPGDRLVDIGSGLGDLIRDALHVQPGVECMGLELSESGIQQSRSKSPSTRFVQTDLLQPQKPRKQFTEWGTVATCSEVLEHVDRPDMLLRNATTHLVPGAIVVITVPAGPRSAVARHIGHRQHTTRVSIGRVTTAAGLESVRIQAAGFPFFDLFRLAALARGKRLIEDAKLPDELNAGTGGTALRVFDWLFRANLDNSPFGWQLLAVARASDRRRAESEPTSTRGDWTSAVGS